MDLSVLRESLHNWILVDIRGQRLSAPEKTYSKIKNDNYMYTLIIRYWGRIDSVKCREMRNESHLRVRCSVRKASGRSCSTSRGQLPSSAGGAESIGVALPKNDLGTDKRRGVPLAAVRRVNILVD